MSDNELQQFNISRKTYYCDYADIPDSAADGDLAFATDLYQLYVKEAGAWVAITPYSNYGLAASIPDASDLMDGSLYFETDTGLLKQVQSSAWVVITGGYCCTGTYTGDGDSDRQITTGFECVLIVIIEDVASGDTYEYFVADQARNCYIKSDDIVKTASYPYLHANDGFVVDTDATGANNNGSEYKYIAFGLGAFRP